jgi:tight adherence protein B
VTVVLPLVVAAATFAAVAWLSERRQARATGRRVESYLAVPRLAVSVADEEVLATRRARWLTASERRLRRLPGWERFVTLVERADIRLTAVELAWVVGVAALLVALLCGAAGASPFAILLVELFLLAALRVALGLRVSRRSRAFEKQLPEFLFDVGSALRAGHGFNQGLQAVAAESPEPIGKEFGRVIAEAQLGRPLDEALRNLTGRIASRDLRFVVEAIIVQRQVGGSLAGVFEIVSESVRQRQHFALRVRALTSMGRLSALVVLALPLGLALLLTAANHAYLSPLLHSPTGQALTAITLGLLVVGGLWLHRLVSMEGLA